MTELLSLDEKFSDEDSNTSLMGNISLNVEASYVQYDSVNPTYPEIRIDHYSNGKKRKVTSLELNDLSIPEPTATLLKASGKS